ncbi:hypothetical protein BHE74_00017377 [Ensete ventricosum]|nr:hypothetical protein BHE74_00017377 [Ensete ventricosum]
MKGASRHIYLISEKHLIKGLRRLNLQKRSWDQKALVRDKRTQRRVLLKNMLQCCHSSCYEESATGELDYFSAYIRLREPDKSEDKAEGAEAGGRKGRGSDNESGGDQLPKSKASVRKEVDSDEYHNATEANLSIAKKGTQMQGNR